MPDGFAEWLAKNPEPDLQKLVKKYGGYNKITPQAWAEHEALMDDWQRRYRLRNNTAPAPPKGNP